MYIRAAVPSATQCTRTSFKCVWSLVCPVTEGGHLLSPSASSCEAARRPDAGRRHTYSDAIQTKKAHTSTTQQDQGVQSGITVQEVERIVLEK